jgi:hypothetical protein
MATYLKNTKDQSAQDQGQVRFADSEARSIPERWRMSWIFSTAIEVFEHNEVEGRPSTSGRAASRRAPGASRGPRQPPARHRLVCVQEVDQHVPATDHFDFG